MGSKLTYTVSLEQCHAHLFNVELTIPCGKGNQLELSLPNWIPGSYLIRDFAKNIVTISAIDIEEHELEVTPVTKSTWQVKHHGQPIKIRYQVYAFDTSVRTAYLDQYRAFFNGTSLFLSVTGFENSPHEVILKKPTYNSEFKVATGLKRHKTTPLFGFGKYIANDYRELIDCPVEITDFDCVQFNSSGVEHYIVLSGKHYADMDKLAADVKKLCEHHIQLFSGDVPFDEYWFLTNILPEGFGGLEHKNSTALSVSNFDFHSANCSNEHSENYLRLLSLFSHEYFHAWNVCRLKPRNFHDVDLSQEAYTQQLWAYEGFTSYYDDLSLLRTGLASKEQYLKLLSQTYSRVNRGSGQKKQNLLESSFYAWTKFYQQGEDAANNIVSYYTKGSLNALWLDLTLRRHGDGSVNLDHLMKHLWESFGENQRGTTLGDFGIAISQLSSGQIAMAFEENLSAKKPIPLEKLLKEFGIEIDQFPPTVSDLNKADTSTYSLHSGMQLKFENNGAIVQLVMEDSPAEKAGLSAKDRIIAVNHLQVTSTTFEQQLKQSPQGSVEFHYFRHGELRQCKCQLVPQHVCVFNLRIEDPDKLSAWI